MGYGIDLVAVVLAFRSRSLLYKNFIMILAKSVEPGNNVVQNYRY
jgi:hypothetical protein